MPVPQNGQTRSNKFEFKFDHFVGLALKGLVHLIMRLMWYCYVFEVIGSGLGGILGEVS